MSMMSGVVDVPKKALNNVMNVGKGAFNAVTTGYKQVVPLAQGIARAGPVSIASFVAVILLLVLSAETAKASNSQAMRNLDNIALSHAWVSALSTPLIMAVVMLLRRYAPTALGVAIPAVAAGVMYFVGAIVANKTAPGSYAINGYSSVAEFNDVNLTIHSLTAVGTMVAASFLMGKFIKGNSVASEIVGSVLAAMSGAGGGSVAVGTSAGVFVTAWLVHLATVIVAEIATVHIRTGGQMMTPVQLKAAAGGFGIMGYGRSAGGGGQAVRGQVAQRYRPARRMRSGGR